MYSPRFCLRAFEQIGPSGREAVLTMLFEALIATNMAYLRERSDIPRLYASGVHYREEESGHDDWQDIPETLARRRGDCEDLACWRIAELRIRDGEHALPFLKRVERAHHVLYHVAVRRMDGSLEDPSRLLRMR